ncbi:MAG TPA: ABC transporter permease [Actinobacteria bacterium]|nr:ABC transporter permease [Actinomycetota bacterium]
MGSLRRIAILAIRFNWASKAKFMLLALLVAVGMTVFLIVTELSRVSSEGLNDAISQDVGETGTYMIQLSTDFGLTLEALAGQVDEALAPYASRPPIMIEVLPAITPECPPFEELGSQPMLILRDAGGAPVALPFGQGLPADTEICFDGQVIPISAVYLPSQSEQGKWGTGLAVESAYMRVVALSTTQPIIYRFTVVTNRQADQRKAIAHSLDRQLEDAALRYGVDIHESIFVARVDRGASIRNASQGIRIVYRIIGWGVLILGGLGLLVSELIVVRDRTWFFGLARAVGARSRHIAALIFADIFLVLVTGTALSVLISFAVQPAASSFARDAFQIDVTLLQPSTIPKLIAGALLVLIVAGVYPALLATRQDPLDVLEPKAS